MNGKQSLDGIDMAEAQRVVPTDAEKLAMAQKIQTRALTNAQIDAACRMWRDPQNWRLTPTGVGKRNLYVRHVQK
jgi:hypothetical protein